MINTYSYNGEDFKAVFEYEGWKIGILRSSDRFSKEGVWERHICTAEAFVLLSGSAVLFAKQNKAIEKQPMKSGVIYEVPKGVWHHIIVSSDATVLVIENSNTSKENTEKLYET